SVGPWVPLEVQKAYGGPAVAVPLARVSPAEGRAVGHAFGGGDDVRLDVPMLDAEPFVARAAPSCLHLVADEDAAVLANDRDGLFEILLGRNDEAARARNRLGHEGGDPAGSRSLDQLLHVFGAGDATFGIGEF